MKKIILKIKNSDISILEYSDLSQLKDIFKKYNIIINKHCLIPDILTISPNIILGIGCKIGNDVIIGENVKIDDEVTVGNDVVIKDNVKIENGVTLSDSVIIESNNIIGEEAIIELGTILENSFYKKTAKSNVTYCGNNKISIGCQLYSIDFWLKHYQKVADGFDYTKSQIDECLDHIKYIKNNI